MSEKPPVNKYMLITFSTLLLICVFLITLVNDLTQERILDNQQLATRKIIADIIPEPYTNDIFNDSLALTEPAYLGSNQQVLVYRARTDSVTSGVIFYPVIAEGYNSQIELAIGVTSEGVISGVRVIREDETAGLGSQVNQNETDWIRSFTGISYATVTRDDWKVSSENGYFDQISGATITSRSVINAIMNTLDYHNIARDELYAQKAIEITQGAE